MPNLAERSVTRCVHRRTTCLWCRRFPASPADADHEEVIQAGDAYYLAHGHIPVIEEDAEIVEFSPLGEYQKTTAALGR